MGRESSLTKSKSSVVDSINQIIDRALSSGVTTIHIEPNINYTVIRFRRGSKLSIANKLPASTSKKMAEQLKMLAKLDVKKTTAPQSGFAEIKSQNKVRRLQIVSLPVMDGEKITIEILREDNQMTLENIGLWGNNLKLLKQALGNSHGLILSVSPQIRPAQDLIALMLNKLSSSSTAIGYLGPSISWLSAKVTNLGSNLSPSQIGVVQTSKFATVGIGLVNSKNLARDVNDLVVNKQHVIAVLPAKSSLNALVVWNQLIPKLTVSPSIVCQYKVNTLCQNCREAYRPSVVEQIQLSEIYQLDSPKKMDELFALEKTALKEGLEPKLELSSSSQSINQLYRKNNLGCDHCDFSGYDGEIGIFEVLEPSEELVKMILKGQSVDLKSIAEGVITLKYDALIKALRGLIDFQTVLQICSITN